MKFFMENKKIMIITILTVGILIIIFGGITYAFFTANNPEGSTAQIISDTGKMLISYDDGTDSIVPVKDIQPSNEILVNKTFTLTGTNTTVGISSSDGLTMPYRVGIKYTSTFSNGMLHYYIKKVEDKSDADVTADYVINPEEDKTEDDYINQTIPGTDLSDYTTGTFPLGIKYFELVTGEFPASLNDKKITFNLILQFPDNNENQDSEKGKSFNGKIVVNYEATFNEDSWAKISENIKAGKTSSYKIGDEKEIEIGDNSYTVRLANKSTPDECTGENFSQTACGFVIEFVDIVEKRVMNEETTNIGSWPASALSTYANNEFYESLPDDLKNIILDTTVISGYGNSSEKENFTSTDKIYLLNKKEINISSGYDTAANSTRTLDYYIDKNNSFRIKKLDETATTWWLRSATPAVQGMSCAFGNVGTSGGFTMMQAPNYSGFAPAFRIGE